jgi:hypothetical protein
MRNPFRSEADAFRFTLVIVGLGVAVALAGIFGGGWVALGVFLGLALGVGVGLHSRVEPAAPEPAIWERGGRPHEKRHILVIANETCASRALVDEIRYRARGYRASVLVVAPALNSPLRTWVSDVDAAMREARERLNQSLGALLSGGVEARGEIGDGDPLQAIEDALRTFGADEIIISTHPPGRSNWLERDVVTKARERFPLPTTHVIVDLEHEQVSLLSPAGAEAGQSPAPPSA